MLDEPHPDPRVRAVADAEPADPHAPPPGCRYHPRCPIGPLVLADREICRITEPSTDHRHHAACHFATAKDTVEIGSTS
jgi:peptide/nickel transport system ATP-binding protein